jgi:hypothetical protein
MSSKHYHINEIQTTLILSFFPLSFCMKQILLRVLCESSATSAVNIFHIMAILFFSIIAVLIIENLRLILTSFHRVIFA